MYIIEVKNQAGVTAYAMATKTDKLILGTVINPDTLSFPTDLSAKIFIQKYIRIFRMAKEVNIIPLQQKMNPGNVIVKPRTYIVVVVDPEGKESYVSYDEFLGYFTGMYKSAARCFEKADAEEVIKKIKEEDRVNGAAPGYKYILEEVV